MKPIDYRNATFAELQGRISGQREVTLQAWQQHGPCTTEQLAEKSGLSILTLRPRTTELYQMGFIRVVGDGPCADGHRPAKGGMYRACTPNETAAHFAAQRRIAVSGQGELEL